MTGGNVKGRMPKPRNGKRGQNRWVPAAVLIAAVLLIAGCGTNAPAAERPTAPAVPPTPSPAPDVWSFRADAAPTVEPEPLPTFTPVPKELTQRILLLKKAGKDGDIAPLMEQLLSVDPESYAVWERILAYWDGTQKKGFVSHKGLPDGLPGDDTLCIVALGYRLNADGTMRDEMKGRLKVLLAAAQKYPDAYILVSGGGTASEDLPDVTEAGCMAKWLTGKGVDPARIIVEDRSTSTYENILFSTERLVEDHPNVTQIALVTSDYHIPRGALFFTTYFIKNGIPLEVTANAAYTTGKGDTESRDVLAGGVARICGLKTE